MSAAGCPPKSFVPTDMKKNDKTGQVGYAWRVKEGSGSAELVGFTVCGDGKKFPQCQSRHQRQYPWS